MATAEGVTPVLGPRARSPAARTGRAREAEEDRRLLGRVRRGDRAALDLLIERCRLSIWRFSFRLTGNEAEADDLAQDTLVRAIRALDGFRGEAAFRTWLMRIASNLWTEKVGRAEYRRRDDRDPEEVDEGRPPGLLEALERDEGNRRLRRAVGRLPPRQRATVVLKVYEEMTLREVAEVLDSPLGTVKANYHHALERLRRELGARGEP